jgi:hypothetical protein
MNTPNTDSKASKELALRVARLARPLEAVVERSSLPAERKEAAVRALGTLVLALRDAARS